MNSKFKIQNGKWEMHKWGECAHFAGAKRPQNERFKRKMHKWDAPNLENLALVTSPNL
jgi:hypothetical protein